MHAPLFLFLIASSHGSSKSGDTTIRVKCSSGLKGDFAYRTCAAFCKPGHETTHCRYCKCMECTICGGTIQSVASTKEANRSKVGRKGSRSPIATAAAAASATTSTSPEASEAPVTARTDQGQGKLPSQLVASSESSEATLSSKGRYKWYLMIAGAIALLIALLHELRYGKQWFMASLPPNAETEPMNPEGLGTPTAGALPAPKADRDLLTAEYRVRALCVSFLCLQYAVYALLRRYSTGMLKEPWSPASVLGMGEIIKFTVSATMISQSRGASEAPPGALPIRLRWLIRNSAKMAVPAFLYLAMNFLGFVSLRRVDAGTFAIMQQSKVFFTALLQRIMLNRVLSVPKWCTLTLLVLGVSLISIHSQPSHACPRGPLTLLSPPWRRGSSTSMETSSYVLGVLAVLTDSALSGFATVYFEKVLKTTVLTVWDRNLQLASWSIAIYLPWALYDQPTQPLYGWSLVTVLLALLGAGGGILVALVIKHADSLAKNLATASSIVITTSASYLMFGGPMSTESVIGCFIVIIAGYTYQTVA